MSYAIIRTAGFQYRVEPGQTIRIPTMAADVGSNVTFDEVLLGSVPMEDMDLVINPKTRSVTPNPESPNIPHGLAKCVPLQNARMVF